MKDEFFIGMVMGMTIGIILTIIISLTSTVGNSTYAELCEETLTYIEQESRAEWLLEHPSCLKVMENYE